MAVESEKLRHPGKILVDGQRQRWWTVVQFLGRQKKKGEYEIAERMISSVCTKRFKKPPKDKLKQACKKNLMQVRGVRNQRAESDFA